MPVNLTVDYPVVLKTKKRAQPSNLLMSLLNPKHMKRKKLVK